MTYPNTNTKYFNVGIDGYNNSIHLGVDTIISPGDTIKFENRFRQLDSSPSYVDGNTMTSGREIKVQGVKIWPNSTGVPFSESSKLVNVFVTGTTGSTVKLRTFLSCSDHISITKLVM